jgi:hypothetical protein
MPNDAKQQTFIEKCYKDTDGKVTIFQSPNLPLLVWLVSVVLQLPALPLRVETGIAYIGNAFLFYWAWLELSNGSNYLRRALGFAVLVALIYPHFN